MAYDKDIVPNPQVVIIWREGCNCGQAGRGNFDGVMNGGSFRWETPGFNPSSHRRAQFLEHLERTAIRPSHDWLRFVRFRGTLDGFAQLAEERPSLRDQELNVVRQGRKRNPHETIVDTAKSGNRGPMLTLGLALRA